MQRHKICEACATVLLVAACLCGSSSSGDAQNAVGVQAPHCEMDKEIPTADRDAIERAALEFMNDVLGSHPDAAYGLMTKEGQTKITLTQFTAAVQAHVLSMAPFDNVHVTNAYLVNVLDGTQIQAVICGEVVSNKTWVAVAAKAVPKQAHVVLAAHTRNYDWAFVLWLIPEQNAWRVENFYAGFTTTAGRTADQLWTMAREQNKKGHLFNANLLYTAAHALAARGPSFQLGISPDLEQDISKFVAPPELQGPPPHTWHVEGATYSITHVSIIGIGGQLNVIIDQQLSAWGGNEDADRRNRKLAEALAKMHPEYTEVFSGIVVRALKPDGSGGASTVYEVGKGFDVRK
jgi:hypothetical protein